MRVTICSSSSETLDNKYLDSSRKVIEYLAQSNFDLNWGAGSKSIMGLCYEIFSNYNRNIYGYTTLKYADMLNDLPNAKHVICDTTFELKQRIFHDADLVLFLPGGTGTISEFFAFLEETRSNDKEKLLILYNETHHFDKMLDLLNDVVERNFNNESIFNYFKVINSYDELVSLLKD